MRRKKLHWWIPAVPVLIAVVILAIIFWDVIMIRIAPKAVLTTALTDVFAQLEERFQDDPLLILAKSIDAEGKYTADVKTETANDLLGAIYYDMTIQTDSLRHQLYAEGTATTSEKSLDLSLYLDTDFMAVSSNNLLNSNYYGITYDTFTEDLRSIPLLTFFINDKMLSQWDDAIKNVQSQMSRDYTPLQIPEISKVDIEKLLLGFLAMPCKIEEQSISVSGKFLNCETLMYRASGVQVGEFLTNLLGEHYSDESVIKATFYLYNKSLVKISISCMTDGRNQSYILNLGLDPANEPIGFQQIQRDNDGVLDDFNVTVTTQKGENTYSEVWRGSRTKDGITENLLFSFEWEPSSGKMDLIAGDISESITFNLSETENGFKLATDDLTKLLQIITQNDQSAGDSGSIVCTISVVKGSQISKPTYKNLSQWSMEDFFALLSSVGSLIGINIGI